MNTFIPIFKADETQRLVYGVMASEEKDKAGEIFDYASSKPYVKAWAEGFERATDGKSVGNVRAQHGHIAAGKLIGITLDDQNKRILVVAKIVDPEEWNKVQQGVYTGFSIGGSYVRRWPDGTATRYTARPAEVSIVDSPCNTSATFTLVKANGATEEKSFRRGQPATNSFIPIGFQKSGSDVAEAELRKALANGKPMSFRPGEEVSASRFQPLSNSLGVVKVEGAEDFALPEKRPFQPKG